jgi:catechol 2,3-dioxygenase-like lactoylglutathione lyase family enzyme
MTMTTNEVTERTSAVEFTTTTRVHVAVNVRSVERSLPFYQTLFAQEPTKLRPGYAKFEVAEPPVNFTLNENPNIQEGVGTFSHFGIQVKSTGEVLAAKDRFVQAGLATFSEDEVTCCYAVQDKVWVTDPDGNNWEVFVVLEADAPVHSVKQQLEGAVNCACNTPAEVAAQGKTISLSTKGAGSCC